MAARKKGPVLKAQKETVFKVDAYDLNEFVKKVTGQEYDSQCYLDGGHDSHHRFNVDGDMYEHSVKEWGKFVTSGEEPSVQVVLDGLCSEGKIEKGIYLISVL